MRSADIYFTMGCPTTLVCNCQNKKQNCVIWGLNVELLHSNRHLLSMRQRHNFCQECPTLNIYIL